METDGPWAVKTAISIWIGMAWAAILWGSSNGVKHSFEKNATHSLIPAEGIHFTDPAGIAAAMVPTKKHG
jgi:hypothetical protein